jgi:outer membrane biosynthesis protein TonB
MLKRASGAASLFSTKKAAALAYDMEARKCGEDKRLNYDSDGVLDETYLTAVQNAKEEKEEKKKKKEEKKKKKEKKAEEKEEKEKKKVEKEEKKKKKKEEKEEENKKKVEKDLTPCKIVPCSKICTTGCYGFCSKECQGFASTAKHTKKTTKDRARMAAALYHASQAGSGLAGEEG